VEHSEDGLFRCMQSSGITLAVIVTVTDVTIAAAVAWCAVCYAMGWIRMAI
jgi:hypothetical protein